MTAVWRLDMPSTEKLVLLALADSANDDGVCWTAVRAKTPGKLDLLTKCSLSERAIQGAIKRLCASGLLSRVERPGKGVIYTVTPAADAPPQQMRPAGNDVNPRSICGETVSNPKIESISHARGSDFFSEFWSLYPRKKAKDAAHRAYLKALKGIDHGTIVASLADQISWGVFDEPEFSPHAASWLNAGRWSDERDPTSRDGPRGHRLNHHDERKRAALGLLAEPGDNQREGQFSLIDGRGHPVAAPDAGGHYQRQPARR